MSTDRPDPERDEHVGEHDANTDPMPPADAPRTDADENETDDDQPPASNADAPEVPQAVGEFATPEAVGSPHDPATSDDGTPQDADGADLDTPAESDERPADVAAGDETAAEEKPADELPAGAVPMAGAPTDEAPATLDAAQLTGIVEALVFASPEPVTLKILWKLLADEPKEEVVRALDRLKARYQEGGGLHVVEVAGGFQITTRPELHEWVRRLFHERTTQKLSVASLETLAVIAYRQPVTAPEVAEIRGVNASGVLSTLLERHLVKIVGRKNVVGRPFLYGTTKEFLIRFGLNDLQDLPKVEDMAQALGFEVPALLTEKTVPDEMLPLDEDGA